MGKAAASILLVEDDLHVQRLIQRVLELEGYRVVCLASSEGAERLVGEDTAVALIDLHIEPDGAVATARRLRVHRPGLGIVFVSGAPLEPEQAAYLTEASGRYLAKPFAPQQLRDAVGAVRG